LPAGIAVDNPNAVVIGLAPSQFHYHQLNEAFRSVTLCDIRTNEIHSSNDQPAIYLQLSRNLLKTISTNHCCKQLVPSRLNI